MNNLNSVLIEGALVEDVHPPFEDGSDAFFTVVSDRFYKKDSDILKEECFVDIWVPEPLIKACLAIGKKGREVRVVGRLKSLDYSESGKRPFLVVVAEHVEFCKQKSSFSEPQVQKESETGGVEEAGG